MQNDPMREFHRLVREERYREARGILETTDELDARTVEKWQAWLNALHHEDRVLAGVQSDKAEPEKATTDALQTVFGSLSALVVALLVVALVHVSFTTPGPFPIVFTALYAIITGWFGWTWLAEGISSDNRILIGTIISGVLMFMLLFSGIPFGYYDPQHLPLDLWLAGVALLLPFNTRMAWIAGETVGAFLSKRLHPDDAKEK